MAAEWRELPGVMAPDIIISLRLTAPSTPPIISTLSQTEGLFPSGNQTDGESQEDGMKERERCDFERASEKLQ